MRPGEKKKQILRVAEEIFAGKGFSGATMREIAERVNIKKPSLYYHFRNKEEIYQSLIIDIYNQLVGATLNPVKAGRNLEEKIRNLIESMVDFWAEHPNFPRIIAHEIITGSDLVLNELIPKFWLPCFNEIVAELNKALENQKEIRRIDMVTLYINIFGMSVFYFFTAPVYSILTEDNTLSREKIDNFKKEVIEMVFEGIRGKNRLSVVG